MKTPTGYRNIEDIRAGDKVLSYNEHTKRLEVQTVAQTFIRKTDRIYTLVYDTGTKLQTTATHPFYIEGKGWVKAADLHVGDDSLLAGEVSQLDVYGGARLQNVSYRQSKRGVIVGITVEERAETVYNFEVNETHTYLVGDADVVVHNAGEEYSPALKELVAKLDRELSPEGIGDQAQDSILENGAKIAAVACGPTLYKVCGAIVDTVTGASTVDDLNEAMGISETMVKDLADSERERSIREFQEAEALYGRSIADREKYLKQFSDLDLENRKEAIAATELLINDLKNKTNLTSAEKEQLQKLTQTKAELQKPFDQMKLLQKDQYQLALAREAYIMRVKILREVDDLTKKNPIAAANLLESQAEKLTRPGQIWAETEAMTMFNLHYFQYKGASGLLDMAATGFRSGIGYNMLPSTEAYLRSLPEDQERLFRARLSNEDTPTFEKARIYFDAYRYQRDNRTDKPKCQVANNIPYNDKGQTYTSSTNCGQ